MARAVTSLLAHDVIQVEFAGRDLWSVAHDVVDKGDEAGQRFTATIQDMDTGRLLQADGRFDELDYSTLNHTAWQRPPHEDEFGWAVDLLREDPSFGPALESGELQPYRPMPPLASFYDADGNVDRAVAVGLRSTAGEHRIVGVRTLDGEIIPEPPGVPAPSTDDCGAPPEPSGAAVAGARQARVKVWQGDMLLWDLVVVRPSASSGTNGSGIELRTVDFLGARVLQRAHLPIINVEFGEEGVAAGCARGRAPLGPRGGGVRGRGRRPGRRLPALHCGAADHPGDGHRRRRLPGRGPVGRRRRPRARQPVGGGPLPVRQRVAAPCRRHHPAPAGVLGGHQLRHLQAPRPPRVLAARLRHPGPRVERAARVQRPRHPGRDPLALHALRGQAAEGPRRTTATGWCATTATAASTGSCPAPHDGTANEFGAGDVWVLRYSPDEMDDGQGYTTDPALARAGLDRLVSGEPVHSEDVVLWYGVHVSHPGDEVERVGPDLVAGHWQPRTFVAPKLLEDEPAAGASE